MTTVDKPEADESIANRLARVHSEIQELCEAIGQQRVKFAAHGPSTLELPQFRGRLHVERDRLICSLLKKATNTHRAVGVLCNADLADDAYALSRVLLENAIGIAWLLLADDWKERIDTYALFLTSVKEGFAEVIESLPFTTEADLEWTESEHAGSEAAVARDVFGDSYVKWAVVRENGNWRSLRVVDIFREVERRLNTSTLYDLMYLDSSTYVHSTAGSLAFLFDEVVDDYYAVAWSPRRERTASALAAANFAMLTGLGAADLRLGFGIRHQLSRLHAAGIPPDFER